MKSLFQLNITSSRVRVTEAFRAVAAAATSAYAKASATLLWSEFYQLNFFLAPAAAGCTVTA